MRELSIWGVKSSRRVRTTKRDDSAERSPDLVDRDFTADRPNRLWVTDLTYVAIWSGVAYVCFIVDAVSRKIVGWRVAGHMCTDCRTRNRSPFAIAYAVPLRPSLRLPGQQN